MKAGTAQKLVLNMISTSVMIRLGRVKGNKMVDMQMTNQKLVERAIRMVMEETNISRDEAEAFAHEAQALGAPLQLLRAPAMVHGFARMLAASPAARQQVELACSAWAELIGGQRPQSK